MTDEERNLVPRSPREIRAKQGADGEPVSARRGERIDGFQCRTMALRRRVAAPEKRRT